jgi:hypothetical protein
MKRGGQERSQAGAMRSDTGGNKDLMDAMLDTAPLMVYVFETSSVQNIQRHCSQSARKMET